MYNFIYQNPVKIIFGKKEISKLTGLLPKNSKIMITYGGGSIKKNGVYDQVVKALDGYQFVEFGGIEPNPKYETLMNAIELGKKEKVDFLLAVGGGSVIDGTKFIAASIPLESDPWDILLGKKEVEKAIPFGAILTLPATGSEMNSGAVISRISTQEKYAFMSPFVMPQFSILDPEVCFSLPKRQVQYLTFPVDAKVQDYFAESLLKTLIETAPEVMKENPTYDDYANFMWTATMALNGLIGCGVPQDWATHGIGHELTAIHGIDHARTLAIVLPGVMNIMRNAKRDKLEQYAYRIWYISAGSSDERINKAIQKTEEFFESVGIKTRLKDYDVDENTIAIITERFKERKALMGEREDISYGIVAQILRDRL